MPENKNSKDSKAVFSRSEYTEYMGQIIVKSNRYLTIMVGPVLIGAWLGHLLDKKMFWSDWGLFLGALLGFVVSVFVLLNKIKEENNSKKDV